MEQILSRIASVLMTKVYKIMWKLNFMKYSRQIRQQTRTAHGCCDDGGICEGGNVKSISNPFLFFTAVNLRVLGTITEQWKVLQLTFVLSFESLFDWTWISKFSSVWIFHQFLVCEEKLPTARSTRVALYLTFPEGSEDKIRKFRRSINQSQSSDFSLFPLEYWVSKLKKLLRNFWLTSSKNYAED